MAWWNRSADRSGDQPGKPRLRNRARGIFEDRFREWPTGPVKMVVQQGAGRIIGYEIDREFVEARPCCSNRAECQRRECWRPFDASTIYTVDDDAAL
jgi:hypothetical protein